MTYSSSSYTYLTATCDLVNLGAPPVNNPRNSSWGLWWIIPIVIVVILVVSVIIVIVKKSRRKQPYEPVFYGDFYPQRNSAFESGDNYPRHTQQPFNPQFPGQSLHHVTLQQLYQMGCELFERGDIHQAVSVWNEVLKLVPNFFPALNNLGCAYMRLEHFDTAIECLHRALAIDPSNQIARNNLLTALALK